jgi:hypothetical protein
MVVAIRWVWLGALLGSLVTFAAAQAEEVQAIATPGKGDLTMCSYRGCNLYHHIKLPAQIAVGDKVQVRFGSNPKQYRFPVVRIVHTGDACTIYSQSSDTEGVEKIEVASCLVGSRAQ